MEEEDDDDDAEDGRVQVLTKTFVSRKGAIREVWRKFNILHSTTNIDSLELDRPETRHSLYKTEKRALF